MLKQINRASPIQWRKRKHRDSREHKAFVVLRE
jgi:hypothetical protein